MPGLGFEADVWACGRVATDGTTSGAGFFARGCVVARSAAGIYTITLDRQLDASNCVAVFTPETAAIGCVFAHTSDSVKTVTWETYAAGADTDCQFSFALYRVAGGSTGAGL